MNTNTISILDIENVASRVFRVDQCEEIRFGYSDGKSTTLNQAALLDLVVVLCSFSLSVVDDEGLVTLRSLGSALQGC